MRTFQVIVNTESGEAEEMNRADFEAAVLDSLQSEDIRVCVEFCKGREIEKVITDLLRDLPTAIIVAGGDGTVATAAGLMENSGVALGIIPMGTFNLAARDHNIPLELKSALRVLSTAIPEPIHLMKISGRPCLCTAIIGFYPHMARMIDEYHGKYWWRKSLIVIWWSILRFAKSTIYRVSLQGVNGSELIQKEFKSRMLAVVPGEYRDTMGIIPERKDTRSQKANIYVFRHHTRIAMLRGMIACLLGKSKSDPDMEEVETTSLEINFENKKAVSTMIDGEILQLPNPLKIEIHSSVLLMLQPR
ncbi:diacylglycerol/lipid kinase family protein [Rubritalea spongiae]|uniref:Diacylglycerol/lipid kinase family protein n=1 Tax=Rubritalea spongiae TaxID=430797 RepID=A0ABW5E3H6_9BACT